MVRVLVLVHQHVAEFPLVVFQHLRLLTEQGDSVEDDVVEVQGAGGGQLFLVGGVDFGDAGHAPVGFGAVPPGEFLRAQVLVLGAADDGEDVFGREGLVVQVQLLQNVLHHPAGVVGIVDGEVLGKAQPVNVPPEDADAGGVEGGGPDIVCHGAQAGGQAVLQLPGGLVGEGDGDDLPGPGRVHGAQPPGPVEVQGGGGLREGFQEGQVLLRRVLRDEVGVAAPAIGQQVVDPLDQNGGLSAARPRQEEQGPLGGHGGLALGVVQPPEVPGDDPFPGGYVALLEVVHSLSVPYRCTDVYCKAAGPVNQGKYQEEFRHTP